MLGSIRDDCGENRVFDGASVIYNPECSGSPSDNNLPQCERNKDSSIKFQTCLKNLDTSNYPKNTVTINNLTQKSSMSPTQANPATAYAHLFPGESIQSLQCILEQNCNSIEETCKNSTQDCYNSLQYASGHKIVSSTCSSQENGIHNFKSETESQKASSAEEESKVPKNLHKPLQFGPSNRDLGQFEPQTPVSDANPFKSKGSVMQKVDLFAATQPSSINQQHYSPTSSRPSPQIYDEFSSPAKRQKLAISPLSAYTLESKEQYFSRSLFENSFSEESQTPLTNTLHIQSLDSISRKKEPTSASKLRPYASLKQSKKSDPNLHKLQIGENYDSSPEPFPNILQRKIGLRDLDQTSIFELPKSQACKNSKLFESSNIGKPLVKECQIFDHDSDSLFNFQENQLKNCGSHSHQNSIDENPHWDQIVAVTEEHVNSIDSKSLDNGVSTQEIKSRDPAPLLSPVQNNETQLPKLRPDLKVGSVCGGIISHTLSPQEVCHGVSSRIIVKKGYLYSDYSEKVPETSPIVHHLPPVDETSMICFQQNVETALEELPSCKLGLDYENTVRISSSPDSRKKNSVSSQTLFCQNISLLQGSDSPKNVNCSKDKESNISVLLGESNKTSLKTDCQSEIAIKINTPAHSYIADDLGLVQKTKNDVNSGKMKETAISLIKSIDKNAYPINNNALPNPKDVPIEAQPNTKTHVQDGRSTSPSSAIRKSKRRARVEVAVAYLKAPSNMTIEKSDPDTLSNTNIPYSNGSINADGRRLKISKNVSKFSKKKRDIFNSSKKITKRKPPEITVAEISLSTRSSKRQSLAQAIKDDSEDPLTAHSPHFSYNRSRLFENMAFAVSFVKNDQERKDVINMILENGGLLLEDGFDSLFESFSPADPLVFDSGNLSLSDLGKSLKFASVIADDYSRKTKYIQALALGLPCISWRWVRCCIAKNLVLDWSSYLLCAGQSSVLGNACRSRILQTYSAAEAALTNTFAARKKIFEGKSVLLIMGKGKAQQKRKTFNFLTRALGPSRIGNVADIFEARKILAHAQTQGLEWDILHVNDHEKNVESGVFGISRKQKSFDNDSWPDPKRVRIITDEIFVQSLIFGELIEG